ncbi:MAG: cytochrome D ubiquinol oxidase subunit II, partial [Verrucomicrobiia bacterium]
RFYHNFHSYRYVRDQLVVRMHRPIPDQARQQLREEFADIIPTGELVACHALREEINEPELAQMPRLCLNFNRHNHGRLRQLLDRINEF